ncbi:MAG: type II toxin-antitoxin system RatA family toxin [Solirubrobacterales bacterium]
MPTIELELNVAAPAARVWEAVTDIERMPEMVESVVSAEVLDGDLTHRTCRWAVTIQGAILQWTETELLDADSFHVRFEQRDGDLDVLLGEWMLTPVDPQLTTVRIRFEFEIGIPLLAPMLDPVAEQAFTRNCEDMLRGIELSSTVEPAR